MNVRLNDCRVTAPPDLLYLYLPPSCALPLTQPDGSFPIQAADSAIGGYDVMEKAEDRPGHIGNRQPLRCHSFGFGIPGDHLGLHSRELVIQPSLSPLPADLVAPAIA